MRIFSKYNRVLSLEVGNAFYSLIWIGALSIWSVQTRYSLCTFLILACGTANTALQQRWLGILDGSLRTLWISTNEACDWGREWTQTRNAEKEEELEGNTQDPSKNWYYQLSPYYFWQLRRKEKALVRYRWWMRNEECPYWVPTGLTIPWYHTCACNLLVPK